MIDIIPSAGSSAGLLTNALSICSSESAPVRFTGPAMAGEATDNAQSTLESLILRFFISEELLVGVRA
jgi:hypothetical protein